MELLKQTVGAQCRSNLEEHKRTHDPHPMVAPPQLGGLRKRKEREKRERRRKREREREKGEGVGEKERKRTEVGKGSLGR
jgi:hypothetical protein